LTRWSKPFDGLGRDRGDKVEILVVVENNEMVEFCACSEDEVGWTGRLARYVGS
jgi:hypothetical protein